MKKSQAAVNALIYIGMIAVNALMFTQVPGMVSDIKTITSEESAVEQSKAIANLLSLSYATPNDIRITYDLPPNVQYSISIENGYVNVSTSKGLGTAKTLSTFTYNGENVRQMIITNKGIE